jgi:amino acid permease
LSNQKIKGLVLSGTRGFFEKNIKEADSPVEKLVTQSTELEESIVKHEQEELRRGLKPRHLQLVALGGIIGSGYFLGTGQVLSSVGPAAIFLTY